MPAHLVAELRGGYLAPFILQEEILLAELADVPLDVVEPQRPEARDAPRHVQAGKHAPEVEDEGRYGCILFHVCKKTGDCFCRMTIFTTFAIALQR